MKQWIIIYWKYSRRLGKTVRAMITICAETSDQALKKSRITKSLISIEKA